MTQRFARPIAVGTGTALLLATAAFALWQGTHVAILWDLSYLLDSSYRLALGQVPYRDFPFVHAPLTFVVQSAIIRLAGRAYWHHALYAALAGAAANLLTWRILQRLLNHKTLALLLTLPLLSLGIYGIYPHPEYDSDAILAVLFALYLLQRITPTTPRRLCLLTGAALIPPVFYKQNIGLFFVAATTIAFLAMSFPTKRTCHPDPELAEGEGPAVLVGVAGSSKQPYMLVLLGAAVTVAAALLALHLTAGLHNYYRWTITFAAQRRLPGLGLMLETYRQTSLLWTLPTTLAALILLYISRTVPLPTQNGYPEASASGLIAPQRYNHPRLPSRVVQTLALALLAAPFLYTLASLPFLNDASDRADQLLSLWPHLLLLALALAVFNLLRRPFTIDTLLPLILLATIHGTFLSQQLWGSTYSLWPLLMLLIACMVGPLARTAPRIATPLAAIVSLTLLVCGTAYALSHERLDYAHLDGPLTRSTTPALRGLATPGPWLPQLDELVQDTDAAIPAGDNILLYPGQDPFFYATGRTPRLPVLLFDPATDPYSPAQLAQSVTDRNIRWLIVNRNLQLTAFAEPNHANYLTALQPLFVLDHRLANYDIYRRR